MAREESSGTTPSSTAMRDIMGKLGSSVQMLVESAKNMNNFNENNESSKKKGGKIRKRRRKGKQRKINK